MQRFLFLSLLGCLFLAACEKEEKPYIERSVGELYREAYQSFEKGKYSEAAESFDEVERQHPYSTWAAKAQLLSAYASFKDEKYTKAISTLDVFITLHPGHPQVAYAYYLRALCYFDDILAVTKDQKNTELALGALNEIIQRFPYTIYARDARFKKDFVLDHLAAKEMDIGRFYLNRLDYIAALNRFREVVIKYPTTTHVPESLYRLIECEISLGIKGEAEKTLSILKHNFASNPWRLDGENLLKIP